MNRFLVVLVTIATARAQYSSLGFGGGFGDVSSLSQGDFYPPPPPPPQLSHFGELGHSSLGFGSGSSKIDLDGKFGSSGDYADRSEFESGKRGQNEQQFAAQNRRQGEEFDASSNGFKQANAAARRINGDSGFFSGENGEKRFADDLKHYFGDQRFSQQGKNEAARKNNNGHRKGRVVKGFKKSHHKDENGRSEQYFDEANDEGENFNVNGESGGFGENQSSAFKGAQENSELRANHGGQRQRYENQQSLDKNHRNSDQYGARKFGAKNSNFESKNGGGQEFIKGHRSSSGNKFQKRH